MRLDLFGTDEPRFQKPRHGRCCVCGDRVIEHPTMRHRVRALWAYTVQHITRHH